MAALNYGWCLLEFVCEFVLGFCIVFELIPLVIGFRVFCNLLLL